MKKSKQKELVKKGVAKVPVVMQMEALECGAACLTMVMAYFGKWVPLEQVRKDCGVSRDGSNAKNVLMAGRSYGLEGVGYKFEPEAIRENGMFPCIIHWNFDHFVVLDGFKGEKAVLNDPARGRVTVSAQEFEESFTGVTIFFQPTESFEPGGKKKSVLAFAKKRMKGAFGAAVFVLLTTIISSLLGVINPVFNRILLDRLLTRQNLEWFMPFIIALAAFSVVQLVISYFQTVYSLKINGKLSIVGSATYMWKVLHLPMEFFSQRMAGDILGRQATNATISQIFVNTFAPLVINMAMMVFYLVVMFRYSIILSFIGIASIFINLLASNLITNRRVNISRVQMRTQAQLASTTMSGISMIETIKSSGAENGFFERWAGYQAGVNTTKVQSTKLNQIVGQIPEFVSDATNIIVMMIGVWLVIQGEFTVGMITAFQGFLTSFSSPAMNLITTGQKLMEMRTKMERIEDVMEYPEDTMYDSEKAEEPEEYNKLSGRIEMKNVTFGYMPLSPPLIENFNLSLKPGSRVAFVGSSGCGKSTLAKLLSGLYQPWSGEILFDGRPIKDIDRREFTSSLAVVDQDITLFEDTISNNIKMWDSSIEDFEMIMAARDAKIHDDIMQRTGGYQYKLNEGGTDFSGGQRQRIEIARVLAQDPTIIIMDEATSALDAVTEYEVVKRIKDRGITCVIIAHRLSTIRDCDEIVVMDRGKVVQRGTHEELYAQEGLYRELVSNE